MASAVSTDVNDVMKSLKDVFHRIATISTAHSISTPRLVAVSKTKPPEMIRAAYEGGQRHFGENYVKDLVEKSNHPLLRDVPDICWHFIGHLQRNKCNQLVSVPCLWMIESIDSNKLATSLNLSWSKLNHLHRLKVMVQVNTSEEESKHGCPVEGVVDLASHISTSCPQLELCGLMTIGKPKHDYTQGPNPDFQLMIDLRSRVASSIGVNEQELELSMGMSADFEEAIKAGSTNVRIGSTIFGTRNT